MRSVRSLLEIAEAMGSQAQASVERVECPRDSVKGPQGTPQFIKKAKLKGHSFSRWRAWENARMARA